MIANNQAAEAEDRQQGYRELIAVSIEAEQARPRLEASLKIIANQIAQLDALAKQASAADEQLRNGDAEPRPEGPTAAEWVVMLTANPIEPKFIEVI